MHNLNKIISEVLNIWKKFLYCKTFYATTTH